MTQPTLHVRVDWANKGTFDGAYDDVTARLLSSSSPTWERGRSSDFSGETKGAASFVLQNTNGLFNPNRNWCDNPSFERGVTGWSTAAIASLIAAGTSITQVTDNAPNAGAKAGEATLTSTLNSGVAFALPSICRFRQGITYAVSIALKSISGTMTVEAGIGSIGTPADKALSTGTISGSWATKTFTWTPSADRTDAVLFVRTGTNAAAVVRIDAVQVQPRSTATAYLEGPTRGELVPGRPVHIYATYSGTDYPQFFGYIERLIPDSFGANSYTVAVTCYDVFKRFDEIDVVVPANSLTQRCARDMRIAMLEDYERGDRNLLPNPSFESNLNDWSSDGPAITRITDDGYVGSCCGQMVALSAYTRVIAWPRLTPNTTAGTVYRFSVYVKSTSGTQTWYIRLGYDTTSAYAHRPITVTTSWQRFDVTYVPTETRGSSHASPLRGWLESSGAGTIRFDAAMLTRGPILPEYSDTGTTGRWPNWCANGGFDGGALNGWYRGWTNFCTNPSFETDTSGWSATADAFHTAGDINRSTDSYPEPHGSYVGMTNGGCHFAVTGTFKQGVQYIFAFHARYNNNSVTFGIGSNGTPTDKAQTTVTVPHDPYAPFYVLWTPSADRTDVHAYIANGNVVYFDAVQIAMAEGQRYYDAPVECIYALPASSAGVISRAIQSATVKWGGQALSFATLAANHSGMLYAFTHAGAYFVAGRSYIVSLWLRAADAMPYKVLIGQTPDGTTWTDAASTTGTLTANQWTQVTLAWTPTNAGSGSTMFSANAPWLFIEQTDTTARTVYVDGVRVIPGDTADDYELARWQLATGAEIVDYFTASSSYSGSVLNGLSWVNNLGLARHWIEATMAAPWYEYHTADRTTRMTLASSESLTDADIAEFSGLDIDRGSIVNVQPVMYSGGSTETIADAASITAYGPRPGPTLGNNVALDLAAAAALGAAVVAARKTPRTRPKMTRLNQFPSQVQREVDDVITVSHVPLGIAGERFSIQSFATSVALSGNAWHTAYQLEEHPY